MMIIDKESVYLALDIGNAYQKKKFLFNLMDNEITIYFHLI